jgi:prefoldin alpha subunit
MSEASQGINIDTMSLDQLNSLKQQQENRLQSLSAQYNAFKDAKDRLNIAKESLSTIPTNGEGGQEIMIPLTESLYAPGKIVNPNEILVELGAGFFVEKSAEDALKVLERKYKVVDKNTENVMSGIEVTSRNVQALNQAMQGKMMEIQAKHAGQNYRNQVEGKK